MTPRGRQGPGPEDAAGDASAQRRLAFGGAAEELPLVGARGNRRDLEAHGPRSRLEVLADDRLGLSRRPRNKPEEEVGRQRLTPPVSGSELGEALQVAAVPDLGHLAADEVGLRGEHAVAGPPERGEECGGLGAPVPLAVQLASQLRGGPHREELPPDTAVAAKLADDVSRTHAAVPVAVQRNEGCLEAAVPPGKQAPQRPAVLRPAEARLLGLPRRARAGRRQPRGRRGAGGALRRRHMPARCRRPRRRLTPTLVEELFVLLLICWLIIDYVMLFAFVTY